MMELQGASAPNRNGVAAIIPAFHEEKHVGDVVRRTKQFLTDVLVVDDGSVDQTSQQAREAGAEVIVHPQNRGKGETIKTGLHHWYDRGSRLVVILDADGQHLPEEIDRFVAAAEQFPALEAFCRQQDEGRLAHAADSTNGQSIHEPTDQSRVRPGDSRYPVRLSHASP